MKGRRHEWNMKPKGSPRVEEDEFLAQPNDTLAIQRNEVGKRKRGLAIVCRDSTATGPLHFFFVSF